MGHTSIVLAAFLATLAGFALLLAAGNRWNPATRRGVLVGLLLLATSAHAHSLTRDNGAIELTRPSIHLHEFLHYYLGTKYYSEIGHTPLYEAIVIADFEDDRKHFVPSNRIRDLRTNRVDRRRGDIIQEGSVAKQRFGPERWHAFKDDVELLRSNFVSRKAWHESLILQDHGYNGSPLTTLLLGAVANQPFLSSLTFLQVMRSMDLLLLAGLGLLLARHVGIDAALAFGVLWLANPLNDYGFVGGSFLRYNFAFALIAAWLAFDRDRLRSAGAWLAVASHLRVFPGLFAVGLLLHDLLRPGAEARRLALRRNAPLYASFAATGAALVALTAFTPAPPGENVWLEFRERISVHASALAYNTLGVDVPFGYSESQSIEARKHALAEGTSVAWEDLVSQTLEARRPYRWTATALLLAAILAIARALPRRYALFLGFPLLFALMYASHYYYLALGLLALVFHGNRAALLALTTGFGAIALASIPTAFNDDVLRMGVISVATIAMLIAAGVAASRTPAAPPCWIDDE